jgi:nicotinate-nucleotide adenylyltransferase
LIKRQAAQRIGFLGGTFDPIHSGHLHLAIELSEAHKLEEVFFCPTGQSPFKKHTPPIASVKDRRGMVTAALSPFPQFTLIDHELHTEEPSYTINTIRELIAADKKAGKKVDYFLILGEDAALSLPLWKEVSELLSLTSPLVGGRQNSHFVEDSELPREIHKAVKKGWTPMPLIEISSSWIRSRIQEGKYAGHLMPGKVWDYIQTHKLYQAKP